MVAVSTTTKTKRRTKKIKPEKKKIPSKSQIDKETKKREKKEKKELKSSKKPERIQTKKQKHETISTSIATNKTDINNGNTLLGPLLHHPSSKNKDIPDYTPYTLQFLTDPSNKNTEYILSLQETSITIRSINNTGLTLPFVLGLKKTPNASKEHSLSCMYILKNEKDVEIYAFDALTCVLYEWSWNDSIALQYESSGTTIIPPRREYIVPPTTILHFSIIYTEEDTQVIKRMYYLSSEEETLSLCSYNMNTKATRWIKKHCENGKLKSFQHHSFSQLLHYTAEEHKDETVIYWIACSPHMISLLHDTPKVGKCHSIGNIVWKEGITAVQIQSMNRGGSKKRIQLLVGLLNGRIYLYHDVFTHIKTMTLYQWHTHPIQSLNFVPNTDMLVSGGEESVLVFWDGSTKSVKPLQTVARTCRGPAGILAIVCSAEGYVVVLGSDNTLTCIRTYDFVMEWKVEDIGIALGDQLMLDRFFIRPDSLLPSSPLEETPAPAQTSSSLLQYNPYTKEIYITKLHGLPGIIQAYTLSPNDLTFKCNLLSSIQNRVSRKEQSAIPSLVPQIKHVVCNAQFMLLVECQYTTFDNAGVSKLYKAGKQEYPIGEITNVQLFTRAPASESFSYEYQVIVPTPHGVHASICGITLGRNVFITCSQEENAFRIWDIKLLEQDDKEHGSMDVSCCMKIDTPNGMHRFIPEDCCSMLAADESIVVIGYTNHITFWNVVTGVLIKSISVAGVKSMSSYRFFLTCDSLNVIIISSSSPEEEKDTSTSITSVNVFTQETNWTYDTEETHCFITSSYYWKQEDKLILSKYNTLEDASTIITLNASNGTFIPSLSSHYYHPDISQDKWNVSGKIQSLVIAQVPDESGGSSPQFMLVVMVANGTVIGFPCFQRDAIQSSLLKLPSSNNTLEKIKRTVTTHVTNHTTSLPKLPVSLPNNLREEEERQLQHQMIQSWFKDSTPTDAMEEEAPTTTSMNETTDDTVLFSSTSYIESFLKQKNLMKELS